MGSRVMVERTCDSCGSSKIIGVGEDWGLCGTVNVLATSTTREWNACSPDCVQVAVLNVARAKQGRPSVV